MVQLHSPQRLRLGRVGACFIIAGAIAMFVLASALPSHAKPPIKVGVLLPFVGPTAQLGDGNSKGIRLAFEKRGFKVADREIELIVEDSKGDPNTALLKVKKLIERDKVHVLVGVILSSVAYAIRDTVVAAEIPWVITIANASGLTREKGSPYIFRTHQPDGAATYYLAKYAYEKLGSRKAVFSGLDYAYGHENAEAFQKGFKEAGGEVLKDIFIPLGTKDYGPYMTSIAQFVGKADTLAFVYSGSDAVKFVVGLQEYGLKNKFSTFVDWSATNPGSMLEGEGEAAVGIYEAVFHYQGLDTSENKEFLKLVKEKLGPFDINYAFGYIGGDVIYRALEQVRGNIEDKPGFLKALRSLRFESIMGPFEFDAKGQNYLFNIYIVRTEKVGGKIDQPLKELMPKKRDPWWIEQSRL